jgi:hypothetical protein
MTTFGKIATLPVDGDVYAQPLYVPRTTVTLAGGRAATRDVVIVATEGGSVYAFDATSGPTIDTQPLWRRRVAGAPGGPVPLSPQDVLCPFIRPDISITATPVVDVAKSVVYVLARMKERDAAGNFRYIQRLYALDLRTGDDALSPAEIRASVAGTGEGSHGGRVDFDPLRENPRAALLLDHGNVYLSWASSCDVGPYHGWVMAYDAATLRQTAVFNTSPNGTAAGIWQGDAGLAADSMGNVYAITGNGTFDRSAPVANYGSTVLQLRLTGNSFTVSDYFTPSDEEALSKEDADLGSSGPMLLPADAATRGALISFTGKDGRSYLVDRAAMGKFHAGRAPASDARQVIRTSDGGFGSSAYWNHMLYVWGSHSTLHAYRVAGGKLTSPVVAKTKTVDPGAMPVVSANGTAGGIVWAIETRTWRGADKPAVLHAYDALDVRRELYNSEMSPARDRAGLATRFAVPTVSNGRVFIGTKGGIDVYGLLR